VEHVDERSRLLEVIALWPYDRRVSKVPSVSELKSRLRAHGLRATAARLAVYEVLIGAGGPVTHGDVVTKLEGSAFDRATTYRNLVDLAEVGIARRSDLGDHLWRFELVERAHGEHEAAEAHPHFVCTECGTVECLPDGAVTVAPVKGAPRALKKAHVEVQVRGTCNDCES
jgi:Fur family ferric uptake transcriptional regulator